MYIRINIRIYKIITSTPLPMVMIKMTMLTEARTHTTFPEIVAKLTLPAGLSHAVLSSFTQRNVLSELQDWQRDELPLLVKVFPTHGTHVQQFKNLLCSTFFVPAWFCSGCIVCSGYSLCFIVHILLGYILCIIV